MVSLAACMKASMITMWESILGLRERLGRGVWSVLVRRQPRVAAVFVPYVERWSTRCRAWCWRRSSRCGSGIGIWSKVGVGYVGVYFIVFSTVYQGVKEVSTTPC